MSEHGGSSAWSVRVLPDVARIMRERTGIELDDTKADLVAARLTRAARRAGAPSAAAFANDLLQSGDLDQVAQALMEELTTHHTYFHREPMQWVLLSERILPEWIEKLRRRRDLRVWSAACSTGEEPYQLAMAVREALGPEFAKWQSGVLATDISERALEDAQQNRFPRAALAQLPASLRERYTRDNSDGTVSVNTTIASEVMFRPLNLTQPFPFSGRFHIIFCRNVMMYFTAEHRAELERRLSEVLEPGGYLFLGTGESLRDRSLLQPVGTSVYRKP